MFVITTAFALSLLGLSANTQPINLTAPGVTTIEDDFEMSDLVTDPFPSFNPSAVMAVTSPDVGPISPGQTLSMQLVT